MVTQELMIDAEGLRFLNHNPENATPVASAVPGRGERERAGAGGMQVNDFHFAAPTFFLLVFLLSL
jgi:hypothetical protein